jgi:hypothetical protein
MSFPLFQGACCVAAWIGDSMIHGTRALLTPFPAVSGPLLMEAARSDYVICQIRINPGHSRESINAGRPYQ